MNRRELMIKAFKGMVLTGLLPHFSSCLKSGEEKEFLFQLNDKDFNYVQLNLYGGPVRWAFDNFLKPLDENKFIPTKMVGGSFKDSDGDVELNLIKLFGYNVPDFWGLKMKSGVSHSSMLNNMLTIRGIDIKVAGHPHGIINTVRPDSTKPSIQGLISDHSKSPLPSIVFGSNPATRSYHADVRGGLIVPLTEKNLLEVILEPFVLAEEKTLFGRKNKKEKVLQEVLGNLKELKGVDDKYVNELYGSLDLFIDNIEPFLEEYLDILSKYEKLIKSNIRNFDGLGMEKLALKVLDKKGLAEKKTEKEWGRYKIDYQTYLRGDNLEEMLENADLGYLPNQFACTEFLLKRGLSNSLMLSTPNEMGSYIYNCNNQSNVLQKSFSEGRVIPVKDKLTTIQMDSHNTGTIMQMIASFMFYKGLVPCLDRLKTELRSVPVENKTLFDKTLIHLCSEFERIPNDDESGTEHNHRSHTSSFISGSIKKFQICGNIRIGNNETGTIGTTGYVDQLGRHAAPTDVYQSVAEIIGVKSPIPRAEALMKWDGDEIVTNLKELKNVEGVSC